MSGNETQENKGGDLQLPNLPFKLGDTFLSDRFEVIDSTGHGEFSIAWKTHEAALGNQVMLKFLLEILQLDEGDLTSFCRGTRRSLIENHPTIVRVFDVGSNSPAATIIAELIDKDATEPVDFSNIRTSSNGFGNFYRRFNQFTVKAS